MTIPERISALREYMKEKNIGAFIIPSTDPHVSEYPADTWNSRVWISGFTGSAGTVVISQDGGGLWTDSRYFLQADTELENSGIELFKMGMEGTPDMIAWVISQVGNGGTVGIDAEVFAASDTEAIISRLSTKDIKLVTEFDPFATIWKDRPEIPKNQFFVLPENITGESTASKIERINKALKQADADSMIIATLDTVAWLCNIRGNDVAFNPVGVGYAFVSPRESILFAFPEKINAETREYLTSQGMKIENYYNIFDYVSNLEKGENVCIASPKINYKLYKTIPAHCRIVDIPSPADLMKSRKNETERQGFRNAHIKDGKALIKFYMWLEEAIPTGEVTEVMIEEKLREYRRQQPLYVGESFNTIAGYAGNGAIVHYHATPESHSIVKPEGLLLIDSGAQFKDGTTDITRTVAAGPITDQMKIDYTCVLKGHIAIATAIFPQGTRGAQLDVLARKALWDNCTTYWHGTGHGVGHFLNVHEGPQNIRLEENPVALAPGMVTSNEPGLYRSDRYGIRIENLIITQEYQETEFGKFYNFETITFCPISTIPIDMSLMTEKEVAWLNEYHELVFDKLSEGLEADELAWLKERTQPISK